ncbi:MAG: WD40 repeat domain-containing protein [Chloroflexi bacterium]|nr:WD40 repeat domain-containing protein [Chloroflexota bacterium]
MNQRFSLHGWYTNMVKTYRVRTLILTLVLCGLLVGTGQAQENLPMRTHSPLAVLDVQYSPDGQSLARVYAEGRLEVLDASSQRIILEDMVELPNPLLRAKVDWSPTGDRLAAGIGSQVYTWDIENGRLLQAVDAGGAESLVYFEDGSYIPEGFVSLQWDSTGALLLAKSVSSRFTVWSTEQQTFIVDQVIGNNPVPIVWLTDNQHISTGNSVFDIQNQTRVFVPRLGQQIPEAASHCGVYLSIASNADRTQIAWGTWNGCIVILDAATGDQIAGYKIADNSNPIWGVGWSPDDRAIVAVDSLGAVRVVDVATGNVTLIAQHDGPLYAVDWADDNSAIAYGGNTQAEETVFAAVSVTEVEQLMASTARPAEFAITPAADR